MYYKQRQPGLVKTITADWRSIPWEVAEEIYSEAAGLAEETAMAQYCQHIKEKYPDVDTSNPQLPNRVAIRRKAGNKAVVDNFVPRYKLQDTGINVIAQIVAHLATLAVTTVEGESICDERMKFLLSPEVLGYSSPEFQTQEALSGLNFLKHHFKTPYMMGLYRFLMLDTRGAYLTKQYTGDARNYCALVPLIMSAFKRYHKIPYNAWNRDEIKWIVNPDLCEAMLYEFPEHKLGEIHPFYNKENLLKLREHGLTWKSGTKQGTQRNPLYTHSLSGMQGTEFSNVPDLAQVMLTQIWCAHPDNRTKYMVLHPDSWDMIPPSLINTDIFLPATDSKINLDDSMPWAS